MMYVDSLMTEPPEKPFPQIVELILPFISL